jgi:Ser/Thr protein kinase RdoA (MazF antagonist)
MLEIHAVTVPGDLRIRTFRPYGLGKPLAPPPGTTVPDAWTRAIAVHAGPAPRHGPVLVHRDFHPGNILWSGSEVSAVIDWSSASVGAPEVDVAHCRVNLAVALGLEAADRFLAVYGQRTGRAEYDPYWDLQALVGLISDRELEPAWIPADDELIRRAVARLG